MLLLLLCNVFTLSAAEELYAQHYNVTLSLRNATVKEAVDAVTRQTGIAFSYESSVGVMPLGNVEIRVDGGAVDAVLGPLFADKGIAWQVVDGVVILTRQNSPPQSDSGRRLTVRGRITAGAGESIVGATVMVKGTQTGVSSDVEGNYEIVVPGPGSVLVFNYLGYQPQEIAVGNRTQIDVRLAEDNNVLDDVVVIGYGTQSRRTLTSAVSKVSGADLEGVPVNSIGDALKGKVPGVRVSTANNQPGSDPVFLIRGGSSINQSNAPIIIVDGVRREMTGLNTNDIESIEILKDAASAGIYGASASNGVILVTTKKGNRAKGPQITFEAQAAWTSPATKFDLMDARDYVVTMRRALNDCPGYTYGQQVLTGANSAGIGNGDSSIWTTRYLQEGESVPRGWSSVVDPVDPSKIIVFQDNDQQSQWFDDSYWMQYYLGVNGGSDKVTYAASASYMKDGGIGINTDFSRFTFHGNTSFKITKSLTAGTTFDYSETSGNEIPSSGIGNYWTILGRGMFMPATHRDYLEDGQPGQGTNSTTISAAWFDRYYTNNYVTRRSTANFNLKWDIVDGLSAFAQIANHNSYKNSYQYLAGNAISQTRQTYEGWSQTNRLSFQAHVDYNKSFGDHNLSAMAGYDFLKRKINGMSMTVQGAESDKTPTLGAGTTPTAWTDTQTPWCQISYFGRLNYNYKEKYMLGFTMRADGSSLFAKDNRWGYFPAVSAGWVVSEEKFWNVEKFNQLKLRLSYGLTGNNNVDYYDTLGAYSVTGIYAGSGATLASTLPNLGLTWEKTKQFDIGLDMAFFNNRLRVAADYYSKKSEDLLFDVSLPDTSGYGSAMQNVGSIRFYGLEFEISSVNVSTKNFSWTTDFTYSFNANKVLSLPDEYYYKDIDGKDAWRIGGYTMSESGYRFGGTAVGERTDDLRLQALPYHRIRGAGRRRALRLQLARLPPFGRPVDRRTQGRGRLRVEKPRGVGAYGRRPRADQRRGHVPAGQCRAPFDGRYEQYLQIQEPDPFGLPRLCAGTFDLQLPVYALLPDLDGQLQLESGLRCPEYMAEARRRHQVRPPDSQRRRRRQPQLLAHFEYQRAEGRLPLPARRDALLRSPAALDPQGRSGPSDRFRVGQHALLLDRRQGYFARIRLGRQLDGHVQRYQFERHFVQQLSSDAQGALRP